MSTPARSRSAQAKKPISQAEAYRKQQQANHFRLLGVLLPIVVFVGPIIGPRLPNPVYGFDWKAVWMLAFGDILFMPYPSEGADLPIPPLPLLTWLQIGLALFSLFVCLTLLMHLSSLYAQRTRSLAAERTYIRLRTPRTVALKAEDGVTLLRMLHGMLPPTNLLRGDGAPLVLRWSARPEQPIVQGLSLLGDQAWRISIQRALKGLTEGTETDVIPDPLLAEVQDGRCVCWCDVRLHTSDALPIAMPSGGSSALLDNLMPALAPIAGVHVTDVQVIVRRVTDPAWRLRVLSRLERIKVDAAAAERRVMEQKAAGPAFEVAIRFIAVADTPDAGMEMVRILGYQLASSTQSVAGTEQRLVAGPPQWLPAIVPPAPPLPRRIVQSCWGVGLLLAVGSGWLLRAVVPWPASAYLLPLLLLVLPRLGTGVWWRKRTQAELPLRLQHILRSGMPIRNPHVVPLWSPWLGHRES
jgi:hypothetical protein